MFEHSQKPIIEKKKSPLNRGIIARFMLIFTVEHNSYGPILFVQCQLCGQYNSMGNKCSDSICVRACVHALYRTIVNVSETYLSTEMQHRCNMLAVEK